MNSIVHQSLNWSLRRTQSTATRRTWAARRRSRGGFGGAEALESRMLYSVSPDPGSTFATAFPGGTLPGGFGGSNRIYSDSVGSADTTDTYAFLVGFNEKVNVELTGLSADANLAVYDFNGKLVAASAHFGTASEEVTFQPAPVNKNQLFLGAYYVKVLQGLGNGNTNYTLTVTQEDAAGQTKAAATNIGPVVGRAVEVGRVTSSDADDYFRFTVPAGQAGPFHADLLHLTADADLTIYDSTGVNPVASSAKSGPADEHVMASLAPGTYYARVHRFSGNTNYELTLTTDLGGNSTAKARTGPFNTPLNPDLGLAFYDFVGANDTVDFYKFRAPAAGKFTAELTGMGFFGDQAVDNADLAILDANGNAVPGGTSSHAGSANEHVSLSLVPGAVYYAKVSRIAGDTNYVLTMTGGDAAGANIAGAFNLGDVTNKPASRTDKIGAGDPYDVYKFTLSATKDVLVNLNNLTASATAQVLASDGKTVLGTLNAAPGKQNATLVYGRPPGTYYVKIIRFTIYSPVPDPGTNYTLTVTGTGPFPLPK